MAPYLIFFLRLLVPLSIFRWPFWGALAAMAADAADVILIDALGWGFGTAERYHAFDKAFDLYYLTFELFLIQRSAETLLKRTGLFLYSWRLLGALAFEATGVRQIIFFAPNIFENFYLIVFGLKRFVPTFRIDRGRRLLTVLLVATVPKLVQEYYMHYLQAPVWLFFKHTIFRWQ